MSPQPCEMPWRIGIDGEALRTPMSGVGRYVFHIGQALEAMLPQARFFAYARGPNTTLALPSARWEARIEPDAHWRRLPSVAWMKWRSPRLIETDQLDLYWAGRTLMPRLPKGVRSLSTVHDLNCWVVPETMPFKHRWAHRFWFSEDIRRADWVVANSQGTAQRLQTRTGVRAAAVACPGLGADFQPPSAPPIAGQVPPALQALGLQGRYLLAVATLEPRKNLIQLVRAFVSLKRAGEIADLQLALIGAPGWGPPALHAELAAARALGVLSTGYVSAELLPQLYQHAEALIFPSIYEGYGMPVMEARACGTRVVVSDVPELREVGGQDAVVVAPDEVGIREGIRTVLQRPRPDGHGLAQQHAWHLAAQAMQSLWVASDPVGS